MNPGIPSGSSTYRLAAWSIEYAAALFVGTLTNLCPPERFAIELQLRFTGTRRCVVGLQSPHWLCRLFGHAVGQAKRLMRTALGVGTRPKMSCLESINTLMLSESIVGTAAKAAETRWRNCRRSHAAAAISQIFHGASEL